MESIALVLTDAALADCIKELGDHADNPTKEQLRAVLPGIVERHGSGRPADAGVDASPARPNAAAVIRDLLKHDELVKLPAAEPPRGPVVLAPPADDPEREAIKARRHEQKRKKQADARTRREQSARARGRT